MRIFSWTFLCSPLYRGAPPAQPSLATLDLIYHRALPQSIPLQPIPGSSLLALELHCRSRYVGMQLLMNLYCVHLLSIILH
ncbi:hypothetical protein K523DRAFT_140115 [Schizophyllum commune Tattone D]|nr:hypothetical protein K523DRAFT_140115 [Schizophyllum commune Tattone D]